MNLKLNDISNKMLNDLKASPALMIITLIVGIVLGSFLFSGEAEDQALPHADHSTETTWTCSMHPQIKLKEAGQCPICFMDLIPLAGDMGSIDPNQLSLSESAMKLARIVTTPVRRGEAVSEIRLSGKIKFDETRVKTISARFPGRLDRLFVDYTGITVNEGDHLFEIYSPELYSAQEELLQAHRRMLDHPLRSNNSAFGAVREKTKLLGLSEKQIDAILSLGEAQSTLQINSPITGIVTHKRAVEGNYVKTGEQIYTIADLSKVWLSLEAYERDLAWLGYGQELTFNIAGLPGVTHSAHISYIDPLVDPLTRSVNVRAVLENEAGLLKPGMLAEATLSVELNAAGKVISPDLSGKWICPMHPEILENQAGDCPICGMDLIPSGSNVSGHSDESSALLIPASAVLKTGKRTLVYVERESTEGYLYELRELVLGSRVGDEYIVISGLSEGDLVVSQGNFKIDSAMQIAGKMSMMSAPVVDEKRVGSPEFQKALSGIYDDYLVLQGQLASDDLPGSQSTLETILDRIDGFGSHDANTHQLWQNWVDQLHGKLETKTSEQTIGTVRASFEHVSNFVLELQNTFGHSKETMLYEVFCPMAFDNQGASWLQDKREVKNPYFGASMLSCGEVKQTYAPAGHSHD